jgi:hypothetical protein
LSLRSWPVYLGRLSLDKQQQKNLQSPEQAYGQRRESDAYRDRDMERIFEVAPMQPQGHSPLD